MSIAPNGHFVRSGSDGIVACDAIVREVPKMGHPNMFPPVDSYRERPSTLPGAVVWTRALVGVSSTPVFPDGSMDLLWIDGRLSVAGPDTRPYHPALGPATRIAGIRFAPGSAPALLGVPAHELRDSRIDLAALWTPGDLRRAHDLVARAHDPVAGLEAVAAWRAARTTPPDPILHAIVTELRSGESISALADRMELGPRRLHRLSLAAFGYGPKTLSRILRMQRALALARAGTPFAEVAARTGYADQAHLSREIRALTGLPLGHLTAAPAPHP